MGRIGVTYEQFCDAVDRLRAKKIKITNSSVRAELGTGSTKTIMDHLRRWREANPDAEPAEQSTDKIRDYADICRLLDARIDAEIEEVQQQYNDYIEETEKTINGLRIEHERQEAELRDAARRIEQLLQQVGEQEGIIAGLHQQLADRTAERDEARGELKSATNRVWEMYERQAAQRDAGAAEEPPQDDDPRQQNLWGQEGSEQAEEPPQDEPQGQGRKRRK